MTARGQANLVGFAAAVVVVATVTVTGVALAGDALADADRQPAATHAAEQVAAHLVDADAAHTRERNVLRADRTANLTLAGLDAAVPPLRGRPVSVTLGGNTLVERDGNGDADTARRTHAAARVERRVRVERPIDRSVRVDLADRGGVTLSDHTGRVAVRIDTRRTRTVRTVRADARVVLHDPSGLSGRYVVAVPETRPLTMSFESDGAPRATAVEGAG